MLFLCFCCWSVTGRGVLVGDETAFSSDSHKNAGEVDSDWKFQNGFHRLYLYLIHDSIRVTKGYFDND